MGFTTLGSCINNLSVYCLRLVDACVGKEKNTRINSVCTELALGCTDVVRSSTLFCKYFLLKCNSFGGVFDGGVSDQESLYDCVGIDKFDNKDINQNKEVLLYLLAGSVGFFVSLCLVSLGVHKCMNIGTNLSDSKLRRRVVSDDFNKTSKNQEALDKLNHSFKVLGLELKDPPCEYFCPISRRLMSDPVFFVPASNNANNKKNIETYKKVSYERCCLDNHFKKKGFFCPLTKIEVVPYLLISDMFLKEEISGWLRGELQGSNDNYKLQMEI